MFINPNDKVAVTDGDNTVYIKAKMDAGTLAAVRNEMYHMRMREGDKEGEFDNLGGADLVLREHNIVGWEGPAFTDDDGKPIPCTRAYIRRMDPTTRLYELVGERIAELNARPVSPDPNSDTPTG